MNVTGTWKGEYAFEESEEGAGKSVAGTVVTFTLKIKQGWLGSFAGTIQEDPRTGFPEPGEVKGSSAAKRSGQSGKLAPCSSTIFITSPFKTATLANFPKPAMRRCLMTSKPGSMTSRTKQKLGTLRVAPQTCSGPPPSARNTPR